MATRVDAVSAASSIVGEQANLCTRWLSSVTNTVPFGSTATAMAELNCPSAVPGLPHAVRKVPVSVNSSMR